MGKSGDHIVIYNISHFAFNFFSYMYYTYQRLPWGRVIFYILFALCMHVCLIKSDSWEALHHFSLGELNWKVDFVRIIHENWQIVCFFSHLCFLLSDFAPITWIMSHSSCLGPIARPMLGTCSSHSEATARLCSSIIRHPHCT